jgi:ElaB/YqjD/DUF883 family membrane-anchored ribosome-binding protein
MPADFKETELREEADPRCVEISALRRQVEEQEKELAALRKTVAERMDDIRKVAADHEKRAARYRRKAEDVLYSARRRGEQIKAQNALAQQRMAQLEAELQQLREDYEKLRRSVPTQAKSRNSGVRGTLRRYFRGRRDELLISRSGLFDEAFYLQACPDMGRFRGAPLRHYLLHGWLEGRRPHPLFDGEWYLREYPDIARAGVNPLVHFLEFGVGENRNPNPFFDLAWYVRRNPDVILSGLNPVVHFVTVGAARLADPSPSFSTRWYLEQNPDVAASAINPLAHYLLHGQQEGRLPKLPETDPAQFRPVTTARIECLKLAPTHGEIALFATYAPDGLLRPHVRGYLEALRHEGIGVVLIVATDREFAGNAPWIHELVDGLFVRSNGGFDFAAWAHVLRLHPEFFDAEILYWVNDSVFGPVNEAAFHKVITRVRGAWQDLVGLTENFQPRWHIQSYFLALKRRALESDMLRQFVRNIVAFTEKRDVIDRYEVELASTLAAAGITASALFKARCEHNPLAFRWRELLDEGFPFVKINTVRDEIPGVDRTGWRDALKALGFDIAVADRTLAEDMARGLHARGV